MALILALREVNGRPQQQPGEVQEALAKIVLDAPNGKIKLGPPTARPSATNFVTEVVDDGKGALFSKVVKVIPDVNQTLGYDRRYSPRSAAEPNRSRVQEVLSSSHLRTGPVSSAGIRSRPGWT